MRHLVSLLLSFLLTLLCVVSVYASRPPEVDAINLIPSEMHVQSGQNVMLGMYVWSGSWDGQTPPEPVLLNTGTLTLYNDLAAPIHLTVQQMSVSEVLDVTIGKYEFEITIRLDNAGLGAPFVVQSPNSVIERIGGDRYKVTVTGVNDIQITFMPPLQVKVTNGAQPAGGGFTLPATGNQVAGSTINISAVPQNAQWYFQRWHSSDMSIFEDPYKAATTMTVPHTDVTITAIFSQEPPADPPDSSRVILTFKAQPNNGGAVLPESGPYNIGDGIIISAVPNGTMYFHRWHAADMSIFEDSTSATTMLTVPAQNTVVTAIFSSQPPPTPTPTPGDNPTPGPTKALSLSTRGEGTVQGGGDWPTGSTVNILALPAEGYKFVCWELVGIGNVASANSAATTVRMDSDITLTAVFEKLPIPEVTPTPSPTKSLSLSARGEGTVQGSGDWPTGSTVNILAIPAEGHKFVCWELVGIGNVGSVNSAVTTVRMDSDITLTAVFEPLPPNMYNITITQSTGFSFNGAGSYKEGDEVSLSVSPINTDVEFVQWNVPANILINPNKYSQTITFTMPASNLNFSITARPIVKTFNLSIVADEGGWIQGQESMIVAQGSVVELRAQAEPGYTFDGWVTSGGGQFGAQKNRISSFTMPDRNVTVTATFKKNPLPSPSPTPGNGSSGNPSPSPTPSQGTVTVRSDNTAEGVVGVGGNTIMLAGRTLNLSATPSNGYAFDRWVIEVGSNHGTIQTPTESRTMFTMGAEPGDVTIVAHFKPMVYSITRVPEGIQVVSPAVTTEILAGTVVTLIVTDSQNRVAKTVPLTTASSAVATPVVTRNGEMNLFTFVMPNSNILIGPVTAWEPVATPQPTVAPSTPQPTIVPFIPQPTIAPSTPPPTPVYVAPTPYVPPNTPQPTPTPQPVTPSVVSGGNSSSGGGSTGNTGNTGNGEAGSIDIGTGTLNYTPHAPVDSDVELDKTDDLFSTLWISMAGFLMLLGLVVWVKKARAVKQH